jgi:hypothetical protein
VAEAQAGRRVGVEIERRFPWGVWALVGALAWAVAMVALGSPTLAILAPVFGVIAGWILGGLVYLVATSRGGSGRPE